MFVRTPRMGKSRNAAVSFAVASSRVSAAAMRTLSAPMPATIVTVHVKAGDAVTKGQVLMLLEAMKMELPIRSPGDEVVAAVHGRAGDLVQADTPLIECQS